MDSAPRRFELHRHEDESGISGTGVVAQGVVWFDGTFAMRWKTERRTTVIGDSVEDLEAIHGHGGKTEIVWIDPEDG